MAAVVAAALVSIVHVGNVLHHDAMRRCPSGQRGCARSARIHTPVKRSAAAVKRPCRIGHAGRGAKHAPPVQRRGRRYCRCSGAHRGIMAASLRLQQDGGLIGFVRRPQHGGPLQCVAHRRLEPGL